jgi:hypothetical protein
MVRLSYLIRVTKSSNFAQRRTSPSRRRRHVAALHLYDNEKIVDSDGTDLTNVAAAREHAAAVARELTTNNAGFLDQNWSGWTMRVHDDNGLELFSLAMSDFRDGNSEK